ncbi:MAG: DUF4136 domain-containing protein [Chryseolinea sp.]
MNRWMICLAFVTIALSASAQSVKTRTENNVDLTRYETFTVLKGESVTPKDQKKASDQALFEAVRNGVRREMEDRGYKYVGDSTAQLNISYVAGAFDFTDAGNVGPLGQAPASDPSELNQSREWSKTSREGMLVIDIADATTKKALWKAEAENIELDRGDLTRVLDATIYKAFKKFPSRLEGKKKKKKK